MLFIKHPGLPSGYAMRSHGYEYTNHLLPLPAEVFKYLLLVLEGALICVMMRMMRMRMMMMMEDLNVLYYCKLQHILLCIYVVLKKTIV